AAPGVNVMAPEFTSPLYKALTRDRYRAETGSSFSAALTSGVAVLVRAQHPDWSPRQVVDRIESTARDTGPYGIDPFYGHGRVDAAAAVGAAAPQPPAVPLDQTFEPND